DGRLPRQHGLHSRRPTPSALRARTVVTLRCAPGLTMARVGNERAAPRVTARRDARSAPCRSLGRTRRRAMPVACGRGRLYRPLVRDNRPVGGRLPRAGVAMARTKTILPTRDRGRRGPCFSICCERHPLLTEAAPPEPARAAAPTALNSR